MQNTVGNCKEDWKPIEDNETKPLKSIPSPQKHVPDPDVFWSWRQEVEEVPGQVEMNTTSLLELPSHPGPMV